MSTIEFEGKVYRIINGEFEPVISSIKKFQGQEVFVEFPSRPGRMDCIGRFRGSHSCYPTLEEAVASWEGYKSYHVQIDYSDTNPYEEGTPSHLAWNEGYQWIKESVTGAA